MLAYRAARLVAVTAFALGLTAAAKAETLEGSAASAEVAKAAEVLSRVQTLTADFDMVTANGINQGQIFVDRSRRAIRVQFDEPLGHLVLVNGPLTQYFGGDGTEIQTATSGTPSSAAWR